MTNSKRHRVIALMFTLTLYFSAAASAAQYSCVGSVSGVTVSAGGVVAAAGLAGSSWPYICTLTGTAPNGVTAESCKALLAVLLTAQTTGKNVQMWYDDGYSCSTRPSWTWMTNSYWGPQIMD